MALFGRRDKDAAKTAAPAGLRPTMGRIAYCRVCAKDQPMTRCWMRTAYLVQCMCCGLAFEDPAALYRRNQPACPRCGEFLEHPGFEYGLCDGCGSKYELVSGAKPGLLPNKRQRDEMSKQGKAWSRY
ncbi:MAG TPA: hypothetical protein PLO62_04070 [Candidatus Hydrogenedentes bacterium]|nr:hypothetical protein [Candidatus Hydrogenedentota bacterium]HOS03607.1 hypothetical protein [Candidatus Hydrogenedentota bacterium]